MNPTYEATGQRARDGCELGHGLATARAFAGHVDQWRLCGRQARRRLDQGCRCRIHFPRSPGQPPACSHYSGDGNVKAWMPTSGKIVRLPRIQLSIA